MKIFYNSKLAKLLTFMSGFKTITLFFWCFTENSYLDLKTIKHEEIHTYEYLDCFNAGIAIDIILLFLFLGLFGPTWNLLYLILIPTFLFYVIYGIDLLIKYIIYKDIILAYKNVAFEKYAYWCAETYNLECEKQHHYLNFEWIKYFK